MIVPSKMELESAYLKLLHPRQSPPSLSELVLYSQWTRFDPRLGEIWVGYLRNHWQNLNPSEFRESLCMQPSPSACAVLLEFVGEHCDSKALPYWCKIVTDGLDKASSEQFFVGLRRLGGDAMVEDAINPMREYSKWGYLGRENLLRVRGTVVLDKAERDNVLKTLLLTMPRIKSRDYWHAVGKCISLRQAERDLLQCPFLTSSGKTKGKIFSKK